MEFFLNLSVCPISSSMDLLPLLGRKSDHHTAIIIEEPGSYVGREVRQVQCLQVESERSSRGSHCVSVRLSVLLSGDPGPAAVLRRGGEASAEL